MKDGYMDIAKAHEKSYLICLTVLTLSMIFNAILAARNPYTVNVVCRSLIRLRYSTQKGLLKVIRGHLSFHFINRSYRYKTLKTQTHRYSQWLIRGRVVSQTVLFSTTVSDCEGYFWLHAFETLINPSHVEKYSIHSYQRTCMDIAYIILALLTKLFKMTASNVLHV